MKKTLIALTVGALAFGAYAEFKKNPDPNTLWMEEGGNTAYGIGDHAAIVRSSRNGGRRRKAGGGGTVDVCKRAVSVMALPLICQCSVAGFACHN